MLQFKVHIHYIYFVNTDKYQTVMAIFLLPYIHVYAMHSIDIYNQKDWAQLVLKLISPSEYMKYMCYKSSGNLKFIP